MSQLTRRDFLGRAAAAGLLTLGVAPATARAAAIELPADVKITAITRTRYPVKHPRKIGRNSFKDHGPGHLEGLVRVKTSAGVEGIGNELSDKLIGKTLGELLEVKDDRLHIRADARPLFPPRSQAVLLDIVGKVLKRPAADLIGPVVRKDVRVY